MMCWGELPMTAPNMPTPLHIPFPPPSGRTVLVVDDEPVIRRIAQISLTASGFIVSEAGDAAAGLAAIRSAGTPFDLVLLDLTLPDGDGSVLIPAIRDHAPGTRILVVSGQGAINAADVGADGSLAKPFTRASLLIAVQFALTNNQNAQMEPTAQA